MQTTRWFRIPPLKLHTRTTIVTSAVLVGVFVGVFVGVSVGVFVAVGVSVGVAVGASSAKKAPVFSRSCRKSVSSERAK